MPKITRQAQHRPEREKAKGRELSEARKEIKQLKRQVSRLQKTIRKMEDERGVTAEIEEASPDPTPADPKAVVLESEKRDQDTCGCGANVWVTFTTPGGKVLRSCKNCKTRR